MNKSEKMLISPKQERSVKSKADILSAARVVFSEKGFSGARIDEMAALSGVNKQRIYAYFGSKEKLYKKVLLDVYAEASENEDVLTLT